MRRQFDCDMEKVGNTYRRRRGKQDAQVWWHANSGQRAHQYVAVHAVDDVERVADFSGEVE